MAEREESQGYYEMLWDCPHCGAKGLLGKTQRRCPECGGPQDADKRYFPSDDQKKAATGHVYEGADAHCPACNSAMGSKVKNCTQCGAPMDGSKPVGGAALPAPAPKKPSHTWKIVLAVVVVLAVVIFGIWWMFLRTRSAEVTVDKHRWEASVAIDQYSDQQKSAWRRDVPVGATNVLCHQEQHGSHSEPDGEECHTEKHDKKDGTFEEVKKCSPKTKSVPDYDDKCNYTIRDWAQVDEVKTTGTGTDVAFGKTGLSKQAAATYGARREGRSTEKLVIEFAGGQSCDWTCQPGDLPETGWKNLKDGAKLTVQVRARSEDVVCDSVIK
jgi:hypothetical protein|nr:hypothetical protein [Kofleriaceae bacterium]